MNREQLTAAMDKGLPVRWKNDGYVCQKDILGQYLVTFIPNGHTIGIFWEDGVGMNLIPAECYIKGESK